MSFGTTAQVPSLIRNMLSAQKVSLPFSVQLAGKQVVLSTFSQGVYIILSLHIISEIITERLIVASRHIMKVIGKGFLAVVWSIWVLAALTVWPNNTFKFLCVQIIGHYPAGFLCSFIFKRPFRHFGHSLTF